MGQSKIITDLVVFKRINTVFSLRKTAKMIAENHIFLIGQNI